MNMNKIYNEELIRLRYSLDIAYSSISKVQALLDSLDILGCEEDRSVPDDVCFDTLLQNEFWIHESKDGIKIPIGKKSDNEDIYLSLGETPTNYSILVNGLPGYGKTTLLKTIVTGASMLYSPANLKLVLIDASRLNEFKVFKDLPHLKSLHYINTGDDYLTALQSLNEDIHQMEDECSWYSDKYNLPCDSYERLCVLSGNVIPRNLVIINDYDNCSIGFNQDSLISLIRTGRKLGYHFVISSVKSDLDLKEIISSTIVLNTSDYFFSAKTNTNMLDIGEAYLIRDRFNTMPTRFKCAHNSLTLVDYCSNVWKNAKQKS